MELAFSIDNIRDRNFVTKIANGVIKAGLLPEVEVLAHLKDCPYYDPGLVCEIKPHTIRSGNRWRPGMDCHLTMFPRSPKRFQFIPTIPCLHVQKIRIRHLPGGTTIFIDDNAWNLQHVFAKEAMNNLALFDGFRDLEEFFSYFDQDFDGQIIHWTNYIYTGMGLRKSNNQSGQK